MKIFKINEDLSVVCEFQKTRTAFRHVANIIHNGHDVYKTKVVYSNRTWESYEFQTVLSKAIFGYFPKADASIIFEAMDNAERNHTDTTFDSLKAVCAFGTLLAKSPEEKAAWNKRMLSTVPGIDIPENFDSLPVEERNRRLDNALEVL